MATDRRGIFLSTAEDLDTVRRIEAAGYESIWTEEGQGKTAFGKLSRWAHATDEVGLGTGIVNVFSRTPAALAQEAATLDAHSGGRVSLGLGVAHPGVVEEFHGVDFERPLRRMHEYVELIRRYLAGEGGGFDGEFYAPERTRFWDDFEPVRSEIPIYNAALGEANVRLTGQVADGWLPALYPLSRIDEGLDHLATGAERAGRSVEDVDVAMAIPAAAAEDPDRARRAAAEYVATYFREIPGYYSRVAEEAGFGENVERVTGADSLAEATTALDDDLLDLLAIAGTPETVRDREADLRTAGVDLPIYDLAPTAGDPDLRRRTIDAFTE